MTSGANGLVKSYSHPLFQGQNLRNELRVKTYALRLHLPEHALVADKRYDSKAIQADLARRNIQALKPDRSNRRVKIEHD
jgi:hypothetical protein